MMAGWGCPGTAKSTHRDRTIEQGSGRVTETVPSMPGGDMTTADFLARAPEVSLLNLRVVEISDLGGGLLQIRLTGADLDGFEYRPGQDLMVLADTAGSRIIRRRYTIRRFDPAERLLDLHVVTESSGPGSRWATALRAGDAVEAIGPRGKITLAPAAEWHLFIGDEVAVPAIAAMVEALPAGATAIVYAEVGTVDDAAKIDAAEAVDLSWTWLARDGRAPGEVAALRAAAVDVALPAGAGHAYVFAEASVVSQVIAVLTERGLAATQISAKAYWGRGRSNASHGEPLK